MITNTEDHKNLYLIITNDNLKLYWHSKDKGTGFDDKETPVYISSTYEKNKPMYHHFRINNAIKVKEDEQFYNNAMQQISNSKDRYKINYVYTYNHVILECGPDYFEDAITWRKNIKTFLKEQWKDFLAIFNDKQDDNTKKEKIQKFCNSFKDCLLGHDGKLGDNIIMTSSSHSGKKVSVDDLLSEYNPSLSDEHKQRYEKMQEIFYPVFKAIKKFIQVITREANKINNPNALLLSTDNNQQPTNFEKDENEIFNDGLNKDIDITMFSKDNNKKTTNFETIKKLMKCEGCCDFGLTNCLKNFLGK